MWGVWLILDRSSIANFLKIFPFDIILLNRKCSIEIWIGTETKISYFRAFTSNALVHIPFCNSEKIEGMHKKWIFIRYSKATKGYGL